MTLHAVLGSLFTLGWRVHWILGNKDTETETVFDHLVADFPEGDIGGKVIEVAGLRIAGLGGVFKPRIWYPRVDEPGGVIEPPHSLREEFLASLPVREQWRGGLPLGIAIRSSQKISRRLAQHRFDVLVSHEAPSCHRHGFAAIDRLAEVAAARLIVHGHHHEFIWCDARERHRCARAGGGGGLGLGDGVSWGAWVCWFLVGAAVL